jgi:YidC/Oxa1 family membrane protein insertase
MQKVREKYKDDQQRQNQEIMKLYKEHKINPFSGCLPMLVQLPVLIAFYKVLSNAIELRGTSFPWIKDLALPDTVATIMGIPINPLPIIMTGCTVWQQKMTPSTGDTQQQKMMMFMPLIMLFMFYNVSAGLVLYWTVQQLLSMAQQWWSMRQPEPATQGPSHG